MTSSKRSKRGRNLNRQDATGEDRGGADDFGGELVDDRELCPPPKQEILTRHIVRTAYLTFRATTSFLSTYRSPSARYPTRPPSRWRRGSSCYISCCPTPGFAAKNCSSHAVEQSCGRYFRRFPPCVLTHNRAHFPAELPRLPGECWSESPCSTLENSTTTSVC